MSAVILLICLLVGVGFIFIPPAIMYDSGPIVQVATMTLLEDTPASDSGTIHVSNVQVGSEFWTIYAAQQHGLIETVEQLNFSYLHIALTVTIKVLTPSGDSISLVGKVEGPAGNTTQTAIFGPSEGLRFSGIYTASVSLVTDRGVVLSSTQTSFTV